MCLYQLVKCSGPGLKYRHRGCTSALPSLGTAGNTLEGPAGRALMKNAWGGASTLYNPNHWPTPMEHTRAQKGEGTSAWEHTAQSWWPCLRGVLLAGCGRRT